MTSEQGEHDEAVDQGILDLEAATQRLIQLVADLASRVDTTHDMQVTLAENVAGLAESRRDRKGLRRFTRWLAFSLALDVALTIAFGVGLFQIKSNSDHIDSIQLRTSNRVLCPLYGLLIEQIDALPPNGADANGDGKVTKAEQKQLDKTIRVVRDGYAGLNCPPSTKP